METGAITPYIDIAQLVLYAFWAFFAGLIIYLILESKREGFPLVSHKRGGKRLAGFLPMPKPKTFILHDGTTRTFPWAEPLEPAPNAQLTADFEGAPLEPLGNPMLDGVGPAAYAMRANTPELTHEGENRTVPMRIATDHWVASDDPDPRGFKVITLDGLTAGLVSDLWVDRASTQLRFVEVAVPGQPRGVVIPIELVRVVAYVIGGVAQVKSVTAAQLAAAPVPASPDCITAREEDRISAYFASGHLYATTDRLGPVL
jgi:photosynthetic reaction center H subunit